MKEIQLTKRNGTKEALDIAKIHKVVEWACEGIKGVSASEVEAQAHLKFYQGMKTSDLHKSLVEAAHELISEESPNYDLVSGRLLMFDLRKRAYGEFEAPSLFGLIKKNAKDGWYSNDLLEMYSEDDWNQIEQYINHDLDFSIRIAGAREWESKYLIQNRSTGKIVESPQIANILVAAILMKKYVAAEGLDIVRDYYEEISMSPNAVGISLASPIIAGIRSTQPQGASCTVMEVGDSLPSIGASTQAVITYAAAKAGLGIGIQNLRAEGQPVDGGRVKTTGPVPFGQLLSSAINACSQGGIRKGSGNLFHTIWHLNFPELIVLKNNRGTEETRIRHMDHSFLLNGYLLRKIFRKEDFTLFSPEEVPDLNDAFYDDQPLFEELYEKYSKDSSKTRRVISGEEMANSVINERSGTSRIYLAFTDSMNEQGTFIAKNAPIRLSNLCMEITLPTIPLQFADDPNGLISLCNLCAVSWGRVKKPQDFERAARLAVFGLDSLLDYQPYLLQAAKNSTEWYRPLGIGVNDFAHFLAKRGLKYNKDALETVDQFMEAQAYYLTKASIELAKIYGPCGKVENTKYSLGQVPHDNRKKTVDELIPHVERFDWNSIRSDLKQYGIRNATLMALMPSETSSKIHNMTNGGEPVRNLIVSKRGTKIVAPEYDKLKNKYDLEFDMDLDGYIEVMAVIQKRVCQAISLNSRYDPTKYPDNQIPGALILRHLAKGYKFGLKTWYYHNNKKVMMQKPVEEAVVLPEIETGEEEHCESCTI